MLRNRLTDCSHDGLTEVHDRLLRQVGLMKEPGASIGKHLALSILFKGDYFKTSVGYFLRTRGLIRKNQR